MRDVACGAFVIGRHEEENGLGAERAESILVGRDYMQTENSLNNVPHCEVVYGIGYTRRILDPLVRRNRN